MAEMDEGGVRLGSLVARVSGMNLNTVPLLQINTRWAFHLFFIFFIICAARNKCNQLIKARKTFSTIDI